MPDHEFTEREGQVFELLVGAMRRFALTWGLFSILILVTGLIVFFAETDVLPDRYSEVLASVVLTIVGAVALILSYLLLRPVDKFRRITTTRGHDMSWLIEALVELAQAQSLLRFMIGITLLGTVVVFWKVVS